MLDTSGQPPQKAESLRERLWAERRTFLLLLAIIFLLLSEWVRPAYPGLADTAKTLGTAMFGVLLATYLYKRFGGEPLVQDLRALVRNLEVANAAEEIGLRRIYATRTAATPDILADIERASMSIRLLAAIYHSEYIKESVNEAFVQALAKAAQNAARRKRTLCVEYYSLDPTPSTDAHDHNSALVSLWAKKEGKRDETVRGQLINGTREFARLVDKVCEVSGVSVDKRRLVLRDYLVPHALLVVDDAIVYVSPYDYHNVRGEVSLTLRFSDGKWAKTLLAEVERVRADFSWQPVAN